GRGHPPAGDALNSVSMLVRISLPAGPEHAALVAAKGVRPEPVYGAQLQEMAIPGVTPEARVRLRYEYSRVRFADGFEVELRKPQLQVDKLGYGPLHPDTLFSPRVAPPMIGLGLLEAIPESAILALADPDDRNGDGISGRPNIVRDQATGQDVLGRFGWKAGQPSLAQQNADAFLNDMGLTTPLLRVDACTEAQTACRAAPSGGDRSEERRVGKECRTVWSASPSSRRRHTSFSRDWSSDVCSSDLARPGHRPGRARPLRLEGRPAQPGPAERRRLPQRHGPDHPAAARGRLHRGADRLSRRAQRWRPRGQREHLQPGAVLYPQPGRAHAPRCGQAHRAGRQARSEEHTS